MKGPAETGRNKLLNRADYVNPEVQNAVRMYNELVKPEGRIALPLDKPLDQASLSQHIDERVEDILFEQSSLEDKVRLTQCGDRDANAWLRISPNAGVGLKLSDKELKIAVAYWLGYDATLADEKCGGCKTCALGKLFKHGATCHALYHRNARHNAVRNEVLQLARGAGYVVNQEGRLPGTLQRPGDIVVRRERNGRDAYFDVAIKTPLQGQGLAFPGMARKMHEEAEAYKCNKKQVQKNLEALGKDFVPLIASTYGVWSHSAKATFSRWASQLALLRRQEPKRVLNKFYQRLSFIILQWNASMILDRLPAPVPRPGLDRVLDQ